MSATGPSDITYKWIISSMDCYPTYDAWQDVVFTVHWRLLATAEYNGKTYTAENYGTAPVDTDTITTFIPYNELTLDLVVSWIYPVVDGDAQKEALAENIYRQINPVVISLPPPWGNH